MSYIPDYIEQAKSYSEALDRACEDMISSVDKTKFGDGFSEVFDSAIPRTMKQWMPELKDQKYYLSPSELLLRITQYKRDFMSPTGYFGQDKPQAREEVGRLMDNFAVAAVAAQEKFRERHEVLAKGPSGREI